MQTNQFEQPATPERLRLLAREGLLDGQALERAFTLTGLIPDGAGWRRFVDVVLLLLGAAFTLSGVIFFFAYNWADMHRFVKFGLIEALMIALVGVAFYQGLERLVGKVSLLGAAVLVGALLAVFGQVYQSGADSYTLFYTWVLLIVGWVLIGRFVPLWGLLWGLVNLSVALYWEQRLDYSQTALWETLFGLNALWLLLWEVVRRQGSSWLERRWFPQVVALAAFVLITSPTLEFIFGYPDKSVTQLAPLLYGAFVLSTLFFYARRIPDLFILTSCAFSIIVVLTASVAELINSSNFGVYLLLSMLVIILAAVAVNLLLRVRRWWEVR
jgi:uncharacterized membrane protein